MVNTVYVSHVQRLVKDDKVGFNYDYMGYAEYEGGTTGMARFSFAECYVEGKTKAQRVTLRDSQDPLNKKIDCVIIGHPVIVDKLGGDICVRNAKGHLGLNDDSVVAWMPVIPWSPMDEPLLIIRADLTDMQQRVTDFYKQPIEMLRNRKDNTSVG